MLSLKTTKDQPSVADADWLSSDMPLLLLSDGSVRALDSTMRTSNSAIMEKDLEGIYVLCFLDFMPVSISSFTFHISAKTTVLFESNDFELKVFK